MTSVHGYYFEDLSLGMKGSFSKTISEADIVLFVGVSGDTNPVHLDEEFASKTMFERRIAHGMLTASLISTVLGTRLPGPGAIYIRQDLRFKAPVHVGDTVLAVCIVSKLDEARGLATFDCRCSVRGKTVVDGRAVLMVSRKTKD